MEAADFHSKVENSHAKFLDNSCLKFVFEVILNLKGFL